MKNAVTQAAISAEYRLLDTWTAILNPWYTNDAWGAATVLPPPGQATILARKEGFVNDTTVVDGQFGRRDSFTDLLLQPLPRNDLQISAVNESGQVTPATVLVDNGFPLVYDVNSNT